MKERNNSVLLWFLYSFSLLFFVWIYISIFIYDSILNGFSFFFYFENRARSYRRSASVRESEFIFVWSLTKNYKLQLMENSILFYCIYVYYLKLLLYLLFFVIFIIILFFYSIFTSNLNYYSLYYRYLKLNKFTWFQWVK